jgi:ribonuclease HII
LQKKRTDGPNWDPVFSFYEGKSQLFAGIDEVGRGSWAGPVVSAVVVLPFGQQIEGAKDSKLLTPTKRQELNITIRHLATDIGIGWVSPGEVDRLGLSWAVRESGIRALSQLSLKPDLIVLDGKDNFLDQKFNSIAIIGADRLCTPVSAASIIAKVARDNYMDLVAINHNGYDLEQNKGYGTRSHQDSLRKYGVSPLHRLSYKPIKLLLDSM